MLTIERILFPTDLSTTSLNAVPLAAHLAKVYGADLHMLHVHVLHSLESTNSDRPFPGEDEARRILEESVPEFSWNRVFHHTDRDIDAPSAILRFAETREVDLIVMASHGRRGIRRLLLGSVAEEVIRLSDRPVLVVRDTGTPVDARGFDRILVPVDFSNHAPTALAYGRELAATWNAELEVLHILERPQYSDMQFPQPISEQELRVFAEDQMKVLTEAIDPGVPIRTRIVSGNAADEIAEQADASPGALVVMPSHGFRGVERLLLGSVTERVLRRSRAPILVLRAAGRRLLPAGSDRSTSSAVVA